MTFVVDIVAITAADEVVGADDGGGATALPAGATAEQVAGWLVTAIGVLLGGR